MEDHIVEEIRRIREGHAAQFNYDLNDIFDDLKRTERGSKKATVSFGPRRIVRPASRAEADKTLDVKS